MIAAFIHYDKHRANGNLKSTPPQKCQIEVEHWPEAGYVTDRGDCRLLILHTCPIDTEPLSVILTIDRKDLRQLIGELEAAFLG